MIQASPQKSNPKNKQKILPLKTPKNYLGHTSERFLSFDFLGFFGRRVAANPNPI